MTHPLELPALIVDEDSSPLTAEALVALSREVDRLMEQMGAQRIVKILAPGSGIIGLRFEFGSGLSEDWVELDVEYAAEPGKYYTCSRIPNIASPKAAQGTPTPRQILDLLEPLKLHRLNYEISQFEGVLDPNNVEEFAKVVYGIQYPHWLAAKNAASLTSLVDLIADPNPKAARIKF